MFRYNNGMVGCGLIPVYREFVTLAWIVV
jgi:hypothetical protein